MLRLTPTGYVSAAHKMADGARCLAMAGLLAALALLVPAAARAEDQRVLVFAAASMKQAIDQAAKNFAAMTGTTVTPSYAASSALAKQISEGAPADIFISADLDWMNFLANKNLIRPDTRINLAGNKLVLIAPAQSVKLDIKIEPKFRLAEALAGGRLAIAEPNSVPAGKYAKAALQKLLVWDSIAGRLAPTENVMAAMILVARGEAPLGIVYGSDAAADERVRVIDTFPETTHPPIVYPAAVTARSNAPDAAKFLAFLSSPDGRSILKDLGFTNPY